MKAGEVYSLNLVSPYIERCEKSIEEAKITAVKPLDKNKILNHKIVEELATATDLADQVDNYFRTMPPLKQKPLVSVIMTSHNTEKYIESAVYSLMDQSYENLEIIVVDDCSTDNTIKILDRISRSTKKVKYYQLNSNLGTYYAKNLGILKSKGEIIFFHDSDDICHQNRIEICVQALKAKPEMVAVRAAYARINPDNGEIVKVDTHTYKLGLITLGCYRYVFDKIGFFNCTTKASDDEFFNRLKRFYKKSSIVDVSQPLYFNTMRADSLISDMVDWKGEKQIQQKGSESRSNYAKAFTELHSTTKVKFRDTFFFPRIRDAIATDETMTKLANPTVPVYVNVCSIPEREDKLKRVIDALYHQCDYIHVYLDNYKNVPTFLLNRDKITFTHNTDKAKSLRDNGKFIVLEKLVSENKDGYYITVDDDINYPADYTNALIKKLDYYNNEVALGVHGVLLPKKLDDYFSPKRKVYSFYRLLECDKLVHLLGTGTTAFRVSKFKDFSLSNFTETGMADVFFAIECKNVIFLKLLFHALKTG